MSRIGGRRFLFAWQMLKAASQPGPEATTWRVGDVEWRRSRQSVTTPDYAVTLDIHRLNRRGVGSWSVLVVTESWWDDRQTLIRSQLWATHLSGDRDTITGWLDEQAAALPVMGLTQPVEAED